MTEPGATVVSLVYDFLKTLMQPHLNATKDWGDLNKTDAGLEAKTDFLGDFDSFMNFLESMQCLNYIEGF